MSGFENLGFGTSPDGRPSTESEKLGRRGIGTLFDQAVVSAANFVSGVIIGRTVVKEEFGLYVLGLSILLLLINSQTALISIPYTFLSPRFSGLENAKYSGSALIHQFGLTLVTIVAIFCGAIITSFGYGPEGLSYVLWILILVVPPVLIREFLRRICFAKLKVAAATLLDVFVGLIQVTGLIALAFSGRLSVYSGLFWVGVSCLLPSVILLIMMKKEFVLGFAGAARDFRQNWSIGKWASAGEMARFFSNQVYPWFLAGFHSAAAVGVYGACMGPLLLANPFYFGMTNFLAPNIAHRLAGRGVIGLRNLVSLTSLFVIAFSVLFCAIMILFGGHIVVLFYGDQYRGNELIVSILALGLLARGCTLPIQSSLLALDRADLVFKSNLLALCVTVTIGLWLVKSYGPLGVAVSLLVGNSMASTFRYFCYRRIIRESVEG